MLTVLEETFKNFLRDFTKNEVLIVEYWTEIEHTYSRTNKYYHNLEHLNNLLIQLLEVKSEIKNWSLILFSLYYHDIVYDPLKLDNEERSAEYAISRMKEINVPIDIIEYTKSCILATKSHVKSDCIDINYFLDADLSVLGQDRQSYTSYCQNVRKEYSSYSDTVYNTGRKKVLQHFLDMDRIFKTAYFYVKFENQAKNNIKMELDFLRI